MGLRASPKSWTEHRKETRAVRGETTTRTEVRRGGATKEFDAHSQRGDGRHIGLALKCLRGFGLALLASAWLYSSACSSSSGAGNSEPVDVSDAIYVGEANDEGLVALLSAKTMEKPSSTPVITAPAEGEQPSGPVEFTYRIGAMSQLRSPEKPSRFVSPLLRELSPSLPELSPFLRELFAGEHVAHAHGAAMNGPAFLLTFSTAGNDKLLRVFTQETSYLPSDAEWQRLVVPAKEITLTVTVAIFDEGLILRDGGPFVSAPLHFAPAN